MCTEALHLVRSLPSCFDLVGAMLCHVSGSCAEPASNVELPPVKGLAPVDVLLGWAKGGLGGTGSGRVCAHCALWGPDFC